MNAYYQNRTKSPSLASMTRDKEPRPVCLIQSSRSFVSRHSLHVEVHTLLQTANQGGHRGPSWDRKQLAGDGVYGAYASSRYINAGAVCTGVLYSIIEYYIAIKERPGAYAYTITNPSWDPPPRTHSKEALYPSFLRRPTRPCPSSTPSSSVSKQLNAHIFSPPQAFHPAYPIMGVVLPRTNKADG